MSASQSAQTGFRAWIPVIGLAFAAFVFNTSEFLPVGLLPDMAASLNESVYYRLCLGGVDHVAAARASYRPL